MGIRACAIVAAVSALGASPARADGKKPASAPDLSRGPALSIGYSFGPVVVLTPFTVFHRPTREGARIAFESGADFRFGRVSPWIVSIRVPIIRVEDIRRPEGIGDRNFFGNIQLAATRVFDIDYNARSFVGLLPAITVGLIMPSSAKSNGFVVPRSFSDSYALYARDLLALTIGAHARADLFVRNGIFAQSGPELQALSSGVLLLGWRTGFGFEPGTQALKCLGVDGVLRSVRLVGEHEYAAEFGDASVIAGDAMGRNGKGNVWRAGVFSSIQIGQQMVSITVRREWLRFRGSDTEGWNAALRMEW
jgi:hypothetical protein